jgi:hypothetical protein
MAHLVPGEQSDQGSDRVIPGEHHSTDDIPINSLSVYRVWEWAMSHRNGHPARATHLSQKLVEDVCRELLQRAGRQPAPGLDLHSLLLQAAATLPPPPCEEGRQAMGSLLAGFANMIACLRKYGDAAVTPRQAEMVVNIGGALAVFMVAELERPLGTQATPAG